MNRSRSELPHIIDRRVKSGAYGPYRRFLHELIPPEGLSVKGVAYYRSGPEAGKAVLAMERIPKNSPRWAQNPVEVIVVVPSLDFQPGQILKRFPPGTRLAERSSQSELIRRVEAISQRKQPQEAVSQNVKESTSQ